MKTLLSGSLVTQLFLVAFALKPDVSKVLHNGDNSTGKPCSNHKDCLIAFTECLDNVCVCLSSFIFQNNTCVPTGFSCPFGETTLLTEQPVKCERFLADPATHQKLDLLAHPSTPQNSWVDDCPAQQFCVLTDQLTGSVGKGFCCPKPKLTCPVGEPLASAHCPAQTSFNTCPSATHSCISLTYGSQQIFSACCPRPCLSGQLHIDGRCWGQAKIGEECHYNAQCTSNSECSEGQCQCKKGFLEFGSNYCSKPNCPAAGSIPVEVISDNKGRPLKCQNDNFTCPANSFCNANGRICCPIPPPFCPSIESYVSMNDRCNLNVPNQCGPDKSCIHWYTAALDATGRRTQQFGLCCPLHSFRG